MNENRNYNTYLKGMKKGNAEKLFFIDRVELDKFDTIIDFGCGGGDILAEIYKLGGLDKVKFIGIDSDDYMRTVARITCANIPNSWFYAELTESMITRNTLIIFSSVLHEVGDYWNTLKNIIKNTNATVAIRDMKCARKYAYSKNNTAVAKLIANSNPKRLAQFVEKYGTNEEAVVHYLLKYSYVDNWSLELEEDYFSVPWDDLKKLGSVLYENNYILDFKKQQVKKDFDIDLEDLTSSTHCQMILKLDKQS